MYLKQTLNSKDDRYQIWNKFDEAIDHLISECTALASNEYLGRKHIVTQYIHWYLHQHCGAPHAKTWYEHHPEAVRETEIFTTKCIGSNRNNN